MMYMTRNVARQYCNRWSKQAGLDTCYEAQSEKNARGFLFPKPNHMLISGYRLLCDGEWELACRAETTTSRFFGDVHSLVDKYGWFSESSLSKGPDGAYLSQPTAMFLPNRFGLFDTYGNANEICDRSLDPLFQDVECIDAIRADELLPADSARPLIRGGSLASSGVAYARSHCRTDRINDGTDPTVGLRVVRTLAPGDVTQEHVAH